MSDLQVAERPLMSSGTTHALDLLTRAVSVVSAQVDGIPHAATIDSFTIVSTHPTVGMVSLNIGSTMLGFIERAGSFAVSLLADDQEWLSRRFASRSRGVGEAQFDGVAYVLGLWTGAPLIGGALAWFEFRLEDQVRVGDHWLMLGDLLSATSEDQGMRPLLRHHRAYTSVDARI